MDKGDRIERAIEALKAYDGQQAMITLGVMGKDLIRHTCYGILDISPDGGWVKVTRQACWWGQELGFAPDHTVSFDISFGTAGLIIDVTMPELLWLHEQPAIVPSSSGA